MDILVKEAAKLLNPQIRCCCARTRWCSMRKTSASVMRTWPTPG